MRITTQMLNDSAQKAGLPIHNMSLLNHIDDDSTNNPLLEALNKNREDAATSAKKDNYEKLDKEVDKLKESAETLMQDGENGIFEQAKESGSNQNIYDGVAAFLDSYNSTVKALRNASNTMNDFYREMMLEASAETREQLSSIGVTFGKNGYISADMEKMKTVEVSTLEALLGKNSDFVNKINFLSEKVSDNAEANIRSLSSAYNANGNLYAAMGSSKFDFWG